MDPELTCRDGSDERDISTVEKLLLWMLRLASIPFLMLIVVLAAMIYVVANLGRHVSVIARRLLCPGKTWGVRVRPHDA